MPPGWSKAPAGPSGSSATSRGASSHCAASPPSGDSPSRWRWTSRQRWRRSNGSGRRRRRSLTSRTASSPRRLNWRRSCAVLKAGRRAKAVQRMGLAHVVITSVDRDDLPNGGAEIFAACIAEIRRRTPGTSVEVLIPDFKGSDRALRIVVEAKPDILNHNLETIDRLYRLARPGGRYRRALALLRRAKQLDPGMLTKSGIICGLGEEWDELLGAMRDLRAQHVDILTVGQYLRPSDRHLPIARYYTPAEFAELRRLGMQMGYRHVEAGPLVRSSYHAWEQVERATAAV